MSIDCVGLHRRVMAGSCQYPLVEQTERPFGYADENPIDKADPSGNAIPIDDRSFGAHAGAKVWSSDGGEEVEP